MPIGSPVNFFHLTGRLCVGPTNLAAAFPHGGTALGEVRSGVFVLNAEFQSIEAEEFGGVSVDYVRLGEAVALTAVLREFDVSALQHLFPNIATSAKSGRPIVSGRRYGASVVRSGSMVSDQSVKLLYSPDAPDHVPAIILYNALPLPEAASEIRLSLSEEAGFPVAFRAFHTTSGYTFQKALLTDMTISP